MKQSKLKWLEECAIYILDSERDDFENQIKEGSDPNWHIYATAYVALYGKSQFEALVKEIRESQNET
jgi:hypothetical protein